ncbi:MAG: hypothetical protein R2788_04635 [Saprospiraceae bacterium]
MNSACYKILRQWTVINWCVVGDQIDQEVVEEESELAMRLSGCLSIINFVCDLDGDGDCDDRTFRDSWKMQSARCSRGEQPVRPRHRP